MSTHAEATSVRHEIVVAAPAERAFRVFTEQLDRIKPRDHNLLDAELETTVLEPRAGGRIYDRAVDGSECEWATVLAFEPPDRFVFSWNISTRWELEPDPGRRSEVEVSFAAEGPDRTRVAIEHRHLDRQGDGWEGMRDGVAGEDGWSLYLSRFAELVPEDRAGS
jgi:uncharacterized protein YndB with AHSA1/START domain